MEGLLELGYEDAIGPLLCRLYELAVSKSSERGGNRSAEGHRFEDEAAQQIYHFALEAGFEPGSPRLTLELPTVSGNRHQFDASFRRGADLYVVECKNTSTAAKDYLYYFNAKIMDYMDAPSTRNGPFLHGIFLSTVPVDESAWRYGIAYGIRIVDPVSPPPELMLRDCSDHSLTQALRGNLEKMAEVPERHIEADGLKPPRVLEEYRFLCERWRNG